MKKNYQKNMSLLITTIFLIAQLVYVIPVQPALAQESPPAPETLTSDITDSLASLAGQSYSYNFGKDERPAELNNRPAYVEGEVIVKFKSSANSSQRSSIKSRYGLTTKRKVPLVGAELMKFGSGKTVNKMIESLQSDDLVEYVQPNYLYYPQAVTPSDARWDELWGLHNTGQPIEGTAGVEDIDIDAPEAWDYTSGLGEVVVAVIDTGVEITHPDLAEKIWVNPGETLNGLDDDGNGYIDDINGWDFYNNDNTVFDASDGDTHGTHVAGTIAALSNSTGVVGVAPNVKIMPLKFTGPAGGTTLDAIAAINYAASKGVKVSNNSWGGPAGGHEDILLKEAIQKSGMVFVAAAGNDGKDNDTAPDSPSGLAAENIISVAAVNNRGELASFSNYGATTVDVGAPGEAILSTYPRTLNQSAGVQKNNQSVVLGFGLQTLTEQDQSALMKKILNLLGVTPGPNTSILLVNDGESDAGYKDYTPVFEKALSVAGYCYSASQTTVDIRSVNQDVYGPTAAEMQPYDAVIWFTGDAYGTLTTTTLTAEDQSNLTNYLAGGGKLVITGEDALYGIEDKPFVTSTLGINFIQEINEPGMYTDLNGVNEFAGDYYAFSGTSSPYNDVLEPNGTGASTIIQYTGQDSSYRFFSGTSMAAPHVAGISAILMAQKHLSATEAIELIKSSGSDLPSLSGKTVTGKLVNLYNAVATQVSQPTVTLGSPSVASSSDYNITFNTSSYGALLSRDCITITFPNGTTLPAFITGEKIKVNNIPVGSSGDIITPNGQSITFNVPVTIGHGGQVNITIDKAANIKNPTTNGLYSLLVCTSTDPVMKGSANYSISTTTDSAVVGGGGGGGGGGGVINTTPPGATTPLSNTTIDNAIVSAVNSDTVTINASDRLGTALTTTSLKALTNTGKPVVVQLQNATFTLPSGALDVPSGAAQVQMAALALGNEIFELTITAVKPDGQQLPVRQFAKPIRVTLPVPANKREAAANGTLKVHWFNESTKSWENMGGTYDPVTGTITFETNHFSKFALLIAHPIPTTAKFTDINGHWAQKDIEFMAANGYINGMGNGKFAPDTAVTRAQFAAMLVNVLKLQDKAKAPFNDVLPDKWYYTSVGRAYSAGIIKGVSAKLFAPEELITREQMAVMICNALRYKGIITEPEDVEGTLSRFVDKTKISDWAKNSAALLADRQMLNGKSTDTTVRFAPLDRATRAEAAVILKNMIEQLNK